MVCQGVEHGARGPFVACLRRNEFRPLAPSARAPVWRDTPDAPLRGDEVEEREEEVVGENADVL
jgi:hypothetical protein